MWGEICNLDFAYYLGISIYYFLQDTMVEVAIADPLTEENYGYMYLFVSEKIGETGSYALQQDVNQKYVNYTFSLTTTNEEG